MLLRCAALAIACLGLFACATPVPEPPHRYPKVVLNNVTPAEASVIFANYFRGMIAKEQTTDWDKLFRRHEIESANDERVVIRSSNPDAFRRVGYMKLSIVPRKDGDATIVESKMSYVQSVGTSFENEVDIYESQASGTVPKAFVYSYQQIFDSIAASVAVGRGGAPAQSFTLKLDPPAQPFRPLFTRHPDRDAIETLMHQNRHDEVRRRMEPLAQAGEVAAQRMLGWYCLRGIGGPVEREKGEQLLRKALDAGDPVALYLDRWYGLLGPQDRAKAFEVINLAIQTGNVDAMLLLGAQLAQGDRPNPRLAHMLFAIAGALGSPYGAAAKTDIAKQLPADQVESADALARRWKERATGQAT
jgi:TPR repeat protein